MTSKNNIFIAFIIFSAITFMFPFSSVAIEIDEDVTLEVSIEDAELDISIQEIESPEETIDEETDEIIEDEIEIEDEDEVLIEDEEEWEIVIIDEPIPGAVPDFPLTESVKSAMEIVPAAVLPKTGDLNSIPQIGLGAIMVFLGVYINRKKDK